MERREIEVRGTVQGVGFRPFVHALATRLGLAGSVRNRAGSAAIAVEGDPATVGRFVDELTRSPPPLARIEGVASRTRPVRGDVGFRIEPSEPDAAPAPCLPPDTATCDDCLRELFDPADRRFGYPFTNCVNCGPRLTIVTSLPYDRTRTTMAGFPLCPACRAEYEDPADRRFHAQPIACPRCGPRLELRDAAGRPVPTGEPLAVFAAALRDGGIGALKGVGGYHLVCDARNADAVAELRRRKGREAKPLAVMAADLAAAGDLCTATGGEAELLRSPRRPIVLLRRRTDAAVADGVAAGSSLLGVMLPHSPVHHLLMRVVGGGPLVMTSGNRSDEPIVYRDEEAAERLRGIADLFLTHDRPIRVRCDDSVTRWIAGAEQPVRRSRGDVPRPLELPIACGRPVLAVGGQMKATFALRRGRQALLSHHLGDLDGLDAVRAFEEDVAHFERLFGVMPERIAHDLHPDYATTRYARERAEREGLSLVPVQHHHAHVAACLAEHGVAGPAIGVAFDGTGYGTDGAIWGGEFLVGDCRRVRRAAHLRYVGMPGGARAIREPWRMAAAHLLDAGCGWGPLEPRVLPAARRVVERMLDRGVNAPPTSSVGRLFDAVAALLGVRDRATYEAQAAAELERLADAAGPETDLSAGYRFEFLQEPPDNAEPPPLVVDARPVVRAAAEDLGRGVDRGRIARRFHDAVVEMLADVCGRLRATTGLDRVALSGGAFQNALLTAGATARLERDGFRVLRHRLTPPGDGGLSLGQLAVAAAQESAENGGGGLPPAPRSGA